MGREAAPGARARGRAVIPALPASCGEFARTRPLLEGRLQVEGYTGAISS